MAEKGNRYVPANEHGERTYIKDISWAGVAAGCGTSFVDVKDGKIIRIRPFHYDWKDDPKDLNPWKMEVRGKTFEPRMKFLPSPLTIAYKKRVYSPARIRHPMKRVDWNRDGERNPQNRGTSKYVRITWEEALDTIVSELKRMKGTYGPTSILYQCDQHGENKVVHGPHGCGRKLLRLFGGYTLQIRDPDSWEGWSWGAKHVWGMQPVGQQVPQSNLLYDISKNAQTLLFWGCDQETTTWGWGGQMPSRISYWWSELGIKQVYIAPDCNYANAVHADKWIPILPNTDAALYLAIAYLWFRDGTYDKEYLETHAYGVDKFEDYVLGREDGVPKTPEWAAPITGVPSRIAKALAKEWAETRTTICIGNGGPGIRGPYSSEPARLQVLCLAMQGLGKPGRNQAKMIEWGVFDEELQLSQPKPQVLVDLMAAFTGGFPSDTNHPSFIPKPLIPKAILEGKCEWHGCESELPPREDQFIHYKYPAEGCSKIHLIWTDSPSWITCWNSGNDLIKAMRHPDIEFIFCQHPWLENDALFADIILPVNTKFEEEDIANDIFSGQFQMVFPEEKCIDTIGESYSDYEIVCMIAERLGLLEEYTEGKTVQDLIKIGYENSRIAPYIGWEEFREKGYYVVPTDKDWESVPAGLVKFYEDPENYPLTTPTGKLEFYATGLAEHFPDDEERPPVPHWIPEGVSHQETLGTERAKKYPLLIMSNHPRWGIHSQHDDISWLREIDTCKVRGTDGYQYHPIWMNKKDAAERGINNGDVVTLYNERGSILFGAYVTERVMPGVVSVDHGAKLDPIVPGEIDRGGAINSIGPRNILSKNAPGFAVSGFLGEVEKTDLEEMRRKYPEAFEKGMSHNVRPVCGRRDAGTGRSLLMGKVMIIDLAICNGCHNCQVACKDEHVANDWSPIAKPQPDTGQFWNKVINLERGSVPKVKVTYHHSICQHCEDAPCIDACRAHAIYRRPDGIVIIDPERCRGNQLCMEACPYENVIYFNDDLNIAQKCTFCAHLLDRGWTETRCSDACPTGAFTFGDEEDLEEVIAQAELLKPELPTRPRVYYLNLPKKWIAGAVYDSELDECTEGARVTATSTQTGREISAVTDNYGDFWLKDLPDGTYTIQIEKAGYLTQKLGPIDALQKDQNLGDIVLWKA